MVCDVFERCGEITTVRLSKKNFAHIRYELEDFVSNAIFLSGKGMELKAWPASYTSSTMSCVVFESTEEGERFFNCSSPFFLLIEFHCVFSYVFYKILSYYVYYYCILIRSV